jgi:NAD(P)-dependent dehydrogenase (short-subunit alcohol dehydrogenase family)
MPRVIRRVLHRSFSSQGGADDRLFAVVSGGSKGIGLSFTKALLSDSKQHVIALSRNRSAELQTLEHQYPGRLQWIQTDLENEDSIKSATSAVASNFPKVDILVNCAGILGDGSPSQPGPERTVSAITKDWLVKSFEVSNSRFSSTSSCYKII